MLQPVDEVAQRGVERRAQRMAGVGRDLAQQPLDRPDDPLVDLLIHDARDPPRALGTHLVPDQLVVVVHRLCREPDGFAQQLLMPIGHEQE